MQKLNASVNQALQTADMKERLDALAFEPVGGTPQQFADYVKTEIAKWARVVDGATRVGRPMISLSVSSRAS